MRRMPQLIPGQKSIKMTSVFKGYNHNTVISDGEMYDMQNMSGDKYPLLSLRRKRGIASYDVSGQDPVQLTGIHGRDKLVYIRGTQVFYNMYPVTGISVSDNELSLPKQIVSYGAYVLIFPDKVYFSTVDTDDCGSMERRWPAENSGITGSALSVSMCRGDGTDYGENEITTNDTPPSEPGNGAFWMDTSGDTKDVLKQWDSTTEEWVEVPTTYVKIQGSSIGIGAGLKEYDGVTLSGLEAVAGASPKIQAQIDALNGTKVVYFCGDDYIVVVGLVSQTQSALADVEVRADRTIPEMDYICESNNRLWGCTYGLVDGQIVNEIRACVLGDFRNWNRSLGISTDSYAASVGTDGPFTGAITQRGYPVFFKENSIHRVSGSQPANFSIQTTIARGVQRGSWRSLAVVAENIYYKARNAVMIYDGNMPEPVSEQLGDMLYSDARAGVLGDKYYISMKDANDNWRIFVYDTTHHTWYKEDAVQALGFGAAEDELYYIDEDHNTLVSVRGIPGSLSAEETEAWSTESDFDWAAEFDLFGTTYIQSGQYDNPARIRNAKYLSMFKIRAKLDLNAYMRLWVKYDDNALYEYIGEKTGTDLKTFVLPVVPKRCDHLRFKITGRGGAEIYDISRIMEVGGDG